VRQTGGTAGVGAAKISSCGCGAAKRFNECSVRNEPLEKDERIRDDNPVERHAAERQKSRYDDERNAGDGNGPTTASHLSIVARDQDTDR